jgi:hypothetical protein
MESSTFLQLDTTAGVIAPSPEGMLAEACNLAGPDTVAALQSTYPIHGRISPKRWHREETPGEYNEIPLSVFIGFIAQYLWEAYGFKTWTPNKFHKIYKKCSISLYHIPY